MAQSRGNKKNQLLQHMINGTVPEEVFEPDTEEEALLEKLANKAKNGGFGGGSVSEEALKEYQKKTDNSLTTTAKTIVGAINEVKQTASTGVDAETIDVTDKTNNGYKEYMAGLKEWSLDCDGFVVISDEGIKILDEQFEARKPVFVEIVAAGRKYTGSGYLTDYPIEFPLDSAVSYSFTISGASALVAADSSPSV